MHCCVGIWHCFIHCSKNFCIDFHYKSLPIYRSPVNARQYGFRYDMVVKCTTQEDSLDLNRLVLSVDLTLCSCYKTFIKHLLYDIYRKPNLYWRWQVFSFAIYYYYYTICMSPVTGISSWYFSWTSGDPHRSGFKLHIAVLSVLCVMFQV